MPGPEPGNEPRVWAGVGAVVVDGEWVLLLRRKKEPEAGHWGIQGGAIEFGETAEAAKRELGEELGVECEVVRLLGVTDHILLEEGVHWVSPVFLARILSGTPGTPNPRSTRRSAGSTWKSCPRRRPCPRRTPSSSCASPMPTSRRAYVAGASLLL